MSRDGLAPGLKPVSAGGAEDVGAQPQGPVAEWGWPQTFSSWPPNLAQLQLLELVAAPNVPQRAGVPWGVAEGGEGARFVELGVWDACGLLPLALQYQQKLKIQ